MKNNSPDAAFRIVDNIHNTSTGSYQSHPLITWEDYYWNRFIFRRVIQNVKRGGVFEVTV